MAPTFSHLLPLPNTKNAARLAAFFAFGLFCYLCYSEHQKHSQNGRVFHDWTFLPPPSLTPHPDAKNAARIGRIFRVWVLLCSLCHRKHEKHGRNGRVFVFCLCPLPKHEKCGRIAHVYRVWVAVASPGLPNLNIMNMAVAAMFIYCARRPMWAMYNLLLPAVVSKYSKSNTKFIVLIRSFEI